MTSPDTSFTATKSPPSMSLSARTLSGVIFWIESRRKSVLKGRNEGVSFEKSVERDEEFALSEDLCQALFFAQQPRGGAQVEKK